MKVKIDNEKCIGCGACTACCPEVFEMKNDKASAKVKESDKIGVKQAAECCPGRAIAIK